MESSGLSRFEDHVTADKEEFQRRGDRNKAARCTWSAVQCRFSHGVHIDNIQEAQLP